MKFINDFWEYCQCYEIPRNYAILSSIGLLAASVNRRVYIKQGDITIHANMYICLVGEQGGRKSTPKDFARDVFAEVFPNMPVAAAMQTREKIIEYLASDESIRLYHDETGAKIEFHPYILFINELKNFLSFNAAGMIEFLTDIYDRKFFDASTIKRGLEVIPNPCINILACETSDWIVDRLKGRIISGGFSRRMVYVYELEKTNPAEMICIPRPIITDKAKRAMAAVKQHLLDIKDISGQFQWTKEGGEFFDEWYRENKRTLPDDPLMRGYRKTKDVQLLKLCMLLAMAYPKPQLLMTPELLQFGLAVLDANEVNMPRLFMSIGRNELAIPQQKIFDLLENNDGWLPKKKLMAEMDKDLTPDEQWKIIRHLKDTDRLFEADVQLGTNGAVRTMIMTRERYVEWKKNGSLKEASNDPLQQRV